MCFDTNNCTDKKIHTLTMDADLKKTELIACPGSVATHVENKMNA